MFYNFCDIIIFLNLANDILYL